MSDESPVSTMQSFADRGADDDRARLTASLLAVGQGDRTAFSDLYRRTSAKLFGVCLRIFDNRTDAEDALQDAYITIWNKAASFEAGRASPISWLVAVTRNRAIDRLRSAGKARLVDLDQAADVIDPTPQADARLFAASDAAALSTCVDGLDPRDAGFIRSAFMNGATYADLAKRDDLPLGTVKSRIRRALIALRDCLGGRS
jgi:RNA polymerase sigma-70 factor, ECF subfamily